MRRAASIFIVLLLSVTSFRAAAQVDSVTLKFLDAHLEEYFRTLEGEKMAVKMEEWDALIEAATNPSVRQRIALTAYDKYLNSKLMGDEAVAVHIVDKWFSTGVVPMNGEVDLMNAKVFADFTRQSLVGNHAPELDLLDQDGNTVHVGGRSDRYSVLFFYDTECSKCKLESFILKSVLNVKDYPLDLYAIYTGINEEAWASWRVSRFLLKAPSTKVINLWDPEVTSDYQVKYGVVQTPRMFLLDRSGTIVGRNLDAKALEKMMDAIIADENYEYGASESRSLMDRLFQTYGDTLKAEDVLETSSMIEGSTLAVGDTISYRHLQGDLLYYLAGKREEAFKEGSLLFVRRDILSSPDIWNTADDSLRVIGMAQMMEGLLSRTPVGSTIPRTDIKGWNKTRRKGGYILFHSEGCPVCQKERAAAIEQGLRCLDVNVDTIGKEKPDTMEKLLETFDLSSLPLVVEIGRNGVVKRRYLTLLK